jgi:hypothetical protein
MRTVLTICSCLPRHHCTTSHVRHSKTPCSLHNHFTSGAYTPGISSGQRSEKWKEIISVYGSSRGWCSSLPLQASRTSLSRPVLHRDRRSQLKPPPGKLHPSGFGIGCFGALFLVLLFFLAMKAFRILFWGPRWGWAHHGGHGPWGWHRRGDLPPMFDEWHRRAHGESAEEKE